MAASAYRQLVTWWPVLLLGWTTIGAYGVAFYSFGVLIEPIHLDTGWSRGVLSAAFSVSALAGAVGASIAGRSIDRFGGAPALIGSTVLGGGLLYLAAEAETPTIFLLTWGAGSGLVSAGAFYNVTMPMTARRYPDRRPLAFSMLTFVGGFASPIYFPLTAFFVDEWGWRVAIQLLGATLPLTVLPAAFLRRGGEGAASGSEDENEQASGYASVREAYRSRRVLQMLAIFALSGTAFTALQVHQVPIMTATGMTLAAAASAAGIRGLLSLPGRALLAVLVGRLGVLRALVSVQGAMALGIVALLAAGPVALIATYVLLTGLAFGTITPLNGLYAIEVYGERKMGTLLGVQRIVVGPAAAIGPILVGISADANGSYAIGMAAMLATSVAAVLLLATMPPAARNVAPEG
ncbi:MAG TPA: MFS transporter [Dehalococcoidia bacterium]|jgi:MFS family permease|nr:MFS transporter [Dehalococcoidia bacterium]